MVWLGCLLNKDWVCKKNFFCGTAAYIAGRQGRAVIYEILFEKAPMSRVYKSFTNHLKDHYGYMFLVFLFFDFKYSIIV
jgi:hypothetical protein